MDNTFSDLYKKSISKVWRGYATVIFLEIGSLKKVEYKGKTQDWSSELGEYTIMIEGNWYISESDQPLFDLETEYPEMDKKLQLFIGKTISDMTMPDKKTAIVTIKPCTLKIIDRKGLMFTLFKEGKEYYSASIDE